MNGPSERGTDPILIARKKAVVATSRKTLKTDTGKPDTYVSCPTCAREIPVMGTSRLPRDFSVLCPNCGRRKVYQLAEVHDLKRDAETPQASGRIQFGKKNWMEPKSKLNTWASWLLH